MVRVVLGGTFESLHAGHSELIKEAFRILEEDGSNSDSNLVHIGLTSDEMAGSKSHTVSDYISRERELNHFISSLLKNADFTGLSEDNYLITKLEDPFGPAVSDDFDVIVVSPETRAGADKINEIRRSNNLPELQIREVDFVLAEDTIPISTSRIYKGEIDRNGNLQKKK
ncbi:pantetheine-phosphate adenylyltransferase [Methanimicrococcus sp. OttesenSCG-928-J09]|nr:pantetheine-phosphate adenylyltransferase [Methanimicrococcus sp. OttesenSCG-928-J09]